MPRAFCFYIAPESCFAESNPFQSQDASHPALRLHLLSIGNCWAAAQICLRDNVPQTPFFPSRAGSCFPPQNRITPSTRAGAQPVHPRFLPHPCPQSPAARSARRRAPSASRRSRKAGSAARQPSPRAAPAPARASCRRRSAARAIPRRRAPPRPTHAPPRRAHPSACSITQQLSARSRVRNRRSSAKKPCSVTAGSCCAVVRRLASPSLRRKCRSERTSSSERVVEKQCF